MNACIMQLFRQESGVVIAKHPVLLMTKMNYSCPIGLLLFLVWKANTATE